MSSTTCDSDVAANSLYGNLVNEADFAFPNIDLTLPEYQIPDLSGTELYADLERLTEADLTSREPRGNGMFDALMEANKAHIQEEFQAGRLTSKEYSEVYVALTGQAMGAAVQYLLSKDRTYYEAALAQSQAKMAIIEEIKTRVELETAKASLREQQLLAKTREAQYAHTKIMIASEDAKRCLTQKQSDQVEYETTNLLPAQVTKLTTDTTVSAAEKLRLDAQTAQISYETTSILPAQLAKITADTALVGKEGSQIDQQILNLVSEELRIDAQTSKTTAEKDQVLYQTTNILPEQLANLVADKNTKVYTVENLLPAQTANVTEDTQGKTYQRQFVMPEQLENIREQTEAHRAKTMDTRTNGTTPVAGSIGAQVALHQQQVKSYQDDAKWKVAKGILDTWITQKSLDDGLVAPTSLQDGSINSAMSGVRTAVGL